MTPPAPSLAAKQRFVVDPERCAVCGLDEQGLRCEQCLTRGYEHALGRARIRQSRTADAAPRPTPPCTDACPLSLCIQGYAKHIVTGEYTEALGHIMSRTVLPEVVCRVCDRPCERVCERGEIDEAVAVNDLKRYVVDWAVAQPTFPWEPARDEVHDHTVGIVGAGPSGLAAAQSLALRGYRVTLFDAADRPGGLLASVIPGYRLAPGALERDVQRVLDLGVRFMPGVRLGEDRSLGELLEQFEAVYLALGAHRSKTLPVDRAEEAPPVVSALDFLRERTPRSFGSGGPSGARAPAAPCAPPMPPGPPRTARSESAPSFRIVVIGGGDAAIDAARSALRRGASSVTIACVEDRSSMPALEDQVTEALDEGIELRTCARPVRLERGTVVLEEGGQSVVLCADLVVTAIGQCPDMGFLDGDSVELRREDGGLEVDPETGRTSHPRVWAGGDLVSAVHRTVTAAMAGGLRAAWAMDCELRSREEADRRSPPALPRKRKRRALPRVASELRVRAPERKAGERTGDFDEVRGAFTTLQAHREAARCMVCGLCGNCRLCIDHFGCPAILPGAGHVEIDPQLCSACGVCVDLCPNQAIRIEPG